ncbi:LOW QUALITY PROTEIN: hypothetical protein V2J09_020224 [Rumex salicifolius]
MFPSADVANQNAPLIVNPPLLLLLLRAGAKERLKSNPRSSSESTSDNAASNCANNEAQSPGCYADAIGSVNAIGSKYSSSPLFNFIELAPATETLNQSCTDNADEIIVEIKGNVMEVQATQQLTQMQYLSTPI